MEDRLSGASNAPQRALLKASGMSFEDIRRPMVGVLHTQNEGTPCGRLSDVVEAAKDGVRAAGGTPVAVPVTNVCAAMAAGTGYTLLSRELIADACETAAITRGFDALVFVFGCPGDIPGMVMAALRLNLPSIFTSGGIMLPGGEHEFSRIQDTVAMHKARLLSTQDLLLAENSACPTHGACGSVPGQCLAESLGLSLPRDAAMPAVYASRIRLSKQAGMQVMHLLDKNILPSDIITLEAVQNALVAELALGGSTDVILHILAIAKTAGLPVTLGGIDSLSAETPMICPLSPLGPHSLFDFNSAGGLPALMKSLSRLTDTDGRPLVNQGCLTVTGQELAQIIESATVQNDGVINKTSGVPPYPRGFYMLNGSLAPEGAVCCASGLPEQMLTHSGTARVFESEEEAESAINYGEISYGDVIVIRGQGPKGGPGMPAMRKPLIALAAKNLERSVVLITDGRFFGPLHCVAIAHVCPETAENGPIALVETGDAVTVDVKAGSINLDVPIAELMHRLKLVSKAPVKNVRTLLARYAERVLPASDGAVLMDVVLPEYEQD